MTFREVAGQQARKNTPDDFFQLWLDDKPYWSACKQSVASIVVKVVFSRNQAFWVTQSFARPISCWRRWLETSIALEAAKYLKSPRNGEHHGCTACHDGLAPIHTRNTAAELRHPISHQVRCPRAQSPRHRDHHCCCHSAPVERLKF